MTLRGGAIFDSRGMIGRIYVERHITLFHTEYTSFGSCGFREEDFLSMLISIISLGQIITVPGLPVWTPGARLAGFIKRTTIHCYTQNMKALGLMVSEKKIILFFPIVRLWKLMTPRVGHFVPQGHDRQDLCKTPHNNDVY